MRIVLVGDYPVNPEKIIGGCQSHIYWLSEYLSFFDWVNVHVVTSGDKQKTLIKKENLTVHIERKSIFPIFRSFIDGWKIRCKVLSLNPDVVQCHGQGLLYSTLILTNKRKYNTISRFHGIAAKEVRWWPFHLRFFSSLIEGLIVKKAGTIVVDTPYVKNYVKYFSNSSIHVIPPGVDNEFFDISPAEENGRLLFVGGVEPRKGLFSLIKALELVKQKLPRAKLVIVGRIASKNYFRKLLDYLTEKKLFSNVKFQGVISRKDLLDEYSKASIFILPSKEESFGIVLLEAMACGKPIVATDVGGIPYVIKNNRNGILVKQGSRDIAKAILSLCRDPCKRRRMSKTNRKDAKKYKWKNIAEKYVNLYKNMVQRNGTGTFAENRPL